ncbi:MAG: MFS transporter [Rhizobiales bacterium]|nr:MFS transporter [Hyphomicrobiales bacterium]
MYLQISGQRQTAVSRQDSGLAELDQQVNHASANDQISAPAARQMAPKARRKQLIGASIGNVLEAYDFIVYAFLATAIARNFFPSDSELAGLLASFGAFGVGFLARPLGALIIGRIGDKKGRKTVLMITIFGMALGTIGIGILPGYATMGIYAPVLLVLLRLIQGLSMGGEWGGATAFIVESAASGKRGLFSSIGQASFAAAYLLGSTVVAIVTASFTAEQVTDWAWRIPFLIGGMLLPVGIYLRRALEETPVFAAAKTEATSPDLAVSSAVAMVSKAFGFTILWTVSYYIMLSYMPTFLTRYAGLTQTQALTCNAIAIFVLVLATPLFGALSDKVGRKPLLLIGCLAFIALPYPLFALMLSKPGFAAILAILIVFNVFVGALSGAAPAALAELFPTRARTTLMSIGYSTSAAIFGGFAPFIATSLISMTGSPISPVYYLVAAGVASGIAVLTFRETAHDRLR